jgi:hypothetical protein
MAWPPDLNYGTQDGTLNELSQKLLSKSKKLILEILRHQTNFEWGGYRLYDGTHTHLHQNPEELTDFIFYLLDYQKKKKLKKFLIIGYLDGFTDAILNKFFQFEEIVAVDTFQESGSGLLFRANLKFKNLTIICGDSTSDRVVNNFNKFAPFDLVFIDGNHSYDFVKKDFENTKNIVSKNGLICFHDIKAPSAPDVGRFYNSLKKDKNYTFKEFYCDWTPMKTGIGIVQKRNK